MLAADDGRELRRQSIPTHVWDRLAVADGQPYLSTRTTGRWSAGEISRYLKGSAPLSAGFLASSFFGSSRRRGRDRDVGGLLASAFFSAPPRGVCGWSFPGGGASSCFSAGLPGPVPFVAATERITIGSSTGQRFAEQVDQTAADIRGRTPRVLLRPANPFSACSHRTDWRRLGLAWGVCQSGAS